MLCPYREKADGKGSNPSRGSDRPTAAALKAAALHLNLRRRRRHGGRAQHAVPLPGKGRRRRLKSKQRLRPTNGCCAEGRSATFKSTAKAETYGQWVAGAAKETFGTAREASLAWK